jgi:hypothetical protein
VTYARLYPWWGSPQFLDPMGWGLLPLGAGDKRSYAPRSGPSFGGLAPRVPNFHGYVTETKYASP